MLEDLTRRGVIPHYNVNEFDFSSLSHVNVHEPYKIALENQSDKSLHLIGLLLNKRYQQTVSQ